MTAWEWSNTNDEHNRLCIAHWQEMYAGEAILHLQTRRDLEWFRTQLQNMIAFETKGAPSEQGHEERDLNSDKGSTETRNAEVGR